MFKGSSSVHGWATFAQLFFLVALLTGSVSDIVPQTITAYVTEIVILPCRITVSGELPTLEWSKEGLSGNITLLYRDGCETFEMKNPAFRYRTNLVLNELKDGNISQIVYNLRLSDGGRYLCRTLRGKKWQVHAILDLIVGSVPDPKLSVVPTTPADGGVTLECKAECWYPEPEITFHDEDGNELTAENPTRTPDSTECFTFTRRVKVQTPINRVICRVHGTRLNQTKNTDFYIPDHWTGSCTNSAVISGFLTFILTCFTVCGTAFLLHKKYCVMKQNCCRLESRDLDECDQNPEFGNQAGKVRPERKVMRPKPKLRGTSQHDQSPHESRSSPDDTEEETQQPSRYSRSTGHDTPENSEPAVATHDKSPSSQKMDRPRNTSKGHPLLSVPSFQRSLSYLSDASVESESLLEPHYEPQSQ